MVQFRPSSLLRQSWPLAVAYRRVPGPRLKSTANIDASAGRVSSGVKLAPPSTLRCKATRVSGPPVPVT